MPTRITLDPLYRNPVTGYLESGYVPMPSDLKWADGHYAPSVMPLEVIRPAPPSAVIGFYSPDYYGYVGRETQIRFTMQGGAYPYAYVIDKAPSGAVISNDPSDKENYGVLKFTPTENGTFQIKVRAYDQEAKLKEFNWTFTVSDGWCVFASPDGDDEDGDGTFDNPYKTIQYARGNTSGGKALILKNGTYTDTTLGITLNSSTINSILAWDRRQAIIDLESNVETNPSILFYVESSNCMMQGIELKNPQNACPNPRILSGTSATNYVYQDDCAFEINGRSGTANSDNVSCFFFGNTDRHHIAQTRCDFSGFVGLTNGWSCFDWYGCTHWVSECNTISDQISANDKGAGMLWPKGTGNKNGDIRNNEFTTQFAGSLIDIYVANVGGVDNATGNIDVSFNLIRATGNAGIWIARSDQAGSRLPIWTRRNTLIGGCIMIFRRPYDATLSSDSDVIQSSIASTDPFKVVLRVEGESSYRPLSDMPSLAASVTNYECHAASGVVGSDGVLIGPYAQYRGTRGHELIKGTA